MHYTWYATILHVWVQTVAKPHTVFFPARLKVWVWGKSHLYQRRHRKCSERAPEVMCRLIKKILLLNPLRASCPLDYSRPECVKIGVTCYGWIRFTELVLNLSTHKSKSVSDPHQILTCSSYARNSLTLHEQSLVEVESAVIYLYVKTWFAT